MKKLFALMLAGVLLCGCTAEPDPTVPDATEDTTPATEEIVIDYNSLELLEFDYEDVYAAAPMGDDLLLFAGDTETTLIRLSGRNHKELAAVETFTWLDPANTALKIRENGICYATETELVFLDADLAETERVSLPGAWRTPVVTADMQNIWYSTGSELRVYNRETGLDRLLRETTCERLWLLGLELNESVAVCQDMEAETTLFYSTATGELLDSFDSRITLSSAGDLWLTEISENGRTKLVFCNGSEAPRVLLTPENSSAIPVPNGILVHTEAEDSATIQFVDPAAGTMTAIMVDNMQYITNAWREDDVLWISLTSGEVCRWDLGDADMQDAAACFGPYYSRESPDTEGLAALVPAIENLENTYSVRIHIYEDAVAAMPENGILISEYQVDALEAGLNTLSAALSRFTPEFLAAAAKSSDDGRIHICLVRSVSGDGCFQFWDDEGNARVALAVGDAVEQDFYHGLAHLIDARVMTRTTSFDGWKSLNPKGFDYTYDYTAAPEANTDAFIDAFATVSPVEDRARVFEYAMLADAGDSFQSAIMQKKLSTLCAGIRKAFKLNDAGPLPWEQYLIR